MSSNSTSTLLAKAIMTGLSIIPMGDSFQQEPKDIGSLVDSMYARMIAENSQSASANIDYRTLSNSFSSTHSESFPMGVSSIKDKIRYKKLMESFEKNKHNFPKDKRDYLSRFVNTLCKLHFTSNLTTYNDYTETLETVIKLSSGLTLSVSQFTNENIDSPAIFTIHRGKALLVADEMDLGEIVKTINEATTM